MFYARKKDMTPISNLLANANRYICWFRFCEARELVEDYFMIMVLSLVGHSSFTSRNLTRENPVLGKIDLEHIHGINVSA